MCIHIYIPYAGYVSLILSIKHILSILGWVSLFCRFISVKCMELNRLRHLSYKYEKEQVNKQMYLKSIRRSLQVDCRGLSAYLRPFVQASLEIL